MKYMKLIPSSYIMPQRNPITEKPNKVKILQGILPNLNKIKLEILM